MRDQTLPSSSNTTLHTISGRGSLWSWLWRVRAPPKVKLFMWKLCREALPTLEILASRTGAIDTACAICGMDGELVKHIMWEFSFTRQIWALSNIPWRCLTPWVDGRSDWVWRVMQGLN
ncbi:UNVERIFIED_CONTAM: hypothetical protein Sradi_4394500 [Sesamum radiatum]|uniref:Reverse transcriptase zinc-binding domain-containing protein n=1 Tax=Sesamum radiatum TaxID=300843 RepID=A0AAW2NP09_SESRA